MVAVIGGTLLVIGVVMLVTPGPGVVVLGLGLGVLAAEFAWARHWLRVIRERIHGVARNAARFAYGERHAAQRGDETPREDAEPRR